MVGLHPMSGPSQAARYLEFDIHVDLPQRNLAGVFVSRCSADFRPILALLDRRGSSCNAGCTKYQPPQTMQATPRRRTSGQIGFKAPLKSRREQPSQRKNLKLGRLPTDSRGVDDSSKHMPALYEQTRPDVKLARQTATCDWQAIRPWVLWVNLAGVCVSRDFRP